MLYQDQNDETLVMLTLAGEQRAYEVLVLRYEKAVIAAANTVIHSRYLAEDAAQDAFITAWMKLNVLREPEKYGAWVCRIAKNCAKNMIARVRSFLSLDGLENCIAEDDHVGNPEVLYASSEEKELLHESISGLPEKVGQVIRLHYFEELSIAEIADRMRVTAGTVKAQLHDGRKRIRKELCAMNEQMNDTLVQRVMKMVDELKLWQCKNSKQGFAEVYRDVLAGVEELPESTDRYHTLADVLMRGWWWLPGEKNDALFARIAEAAEQGKNDEAMAFIAHREDLKLLGRPRIEFIRDKQIPRLEAGGFVRALAQEWFWLADAYFSDGQPEEGFAAYAKVREIVTPADLYYAYATAAIAMEKQCLAEFAGKPTDHYRLGAGASEYRVLDGALCRWDRHWISEGRLLSIDHDIDHIFNYASSCDGRFTVPGLAVGETHTGTDGTTLTFADDAAVVETPCGRFDGCQLWVTRHDGAVFRTYFRDGVGIVRLEHRRDGITEVRSLCGYDILGGKGLIPCAAGNTWRYTAGDDAETMRHASTFTVIHADDAGMILAHNWMLERLRYDENSWADMIQQIRNDYFREVEKGKKRVCDVRPAIARAEALAATPLQKAHTKAACSVARRILETNPTFNPDCTTTGHWNFFARSAVEAREGKLCIAGNFRWSFELKNIHGNGHPDTPLLYNDILGILQDGAGCIWSDKWVPGYAETVEFTLWNSYCLKTTLRCEDAGSVTTAAGTFDHCLKLSLDIQGLEGGLAYRGGRKEYTFAPGIGIVRTENEYGRGACRAVYELSAYTGTGEGYMPMADGLVRRYDALDLTDGYAAGAEYTYAADENGQIVIFEDRCGIRRKLDPITQYSAIWGEQIEEQLWHEKKRDESRLRHDVNNFRLLLHFLCRDTRNWAAPEKAAAWAKYRMRICEFLGEGEVPRAWLGHYANSAFKAACALFGCGRKEEGYAYLERAFELYPAWLAIPDGERLEVGDEQIYGGVKVVKGEDMLVLPDGTRELLDYTDHTDPFAHTSGEMYYGMTAPRGWEWFDSVRDEDRFKAAIDRAKTLMETKKA